MVVLKTVIIFCQIKRLFNYHRQILNSFKLSNKYAPMYNNFLWVCWSLAKNQSSFNPLKKLITHLMLLSHYLVDLTKVWTFFHNVVIYATSSIWNVFSKFEELSEKFKKVSWEQLGLELCFLVRDLPKVCFPSVNTHLFYNAIDSHFPETYTDTYSSAFYWQVQ